MFGAQVKVVREGTDEAHLFLNLLLEEPGDGPENPASEAAGFQADASDPGTEKEALNWQAQESNMP